MWPEGAKDTKHTRAQLLLELNLYTRVSCGNTIFILSTLQVKRLEWAQQFIWRGRKWLQ